jgi:Leishmanolysin
LQLIDVTNAIDQRLFAEAANAWTQVVVGDLGSRVLANAPDVPPAGCTYPNEIDDLYICVVYAAIDGPLANSTEGSVNVLASAGPTWVRGVNFLPVAGFMRFDEADVPALRNNNGLPNVIRHEMAHVLGFGNLWDRVGLVSLPPATATCEYLGPLANAEYQALSGCASDASLPLELEGGSGRACVHWAEDCLATELMTPILDDDIVNGLSRMTIASLEDLGYDVSYRTAQPWTNADLAASCVCRRGRRRATTFAADTTTKRRLPSAAAYQAAVDYGQSILRSNALAMSEDSSSRIADDDLVYVGDQVISILFEENGALHSIVVTN